VPSVHSKVEIEAIPGIPTVVPGASLGHLIAGALEDAGRTLNECDVVVVASKVVSRAENRFVDLRTVEPSAEAQTVAAEVDKDPALVELVLRESTHVSRKTRGVLITRSRIGIVSANAGLDTSNAAPSGVSESERQHWVLLLPKEPDKSARDIREHLQTHCGCRLGVIISDSLGRPFRVGTVGAAIGVAGLPAVWDQRGRHDRHGKSLEFTWTGLADQIAAAADMVAGQADEGRAAVVVRGVRFEEHSEGTAPLVRDPESDLYL